MVADVGIIGGTGIGERLLALPGTALHIPTAEGMLRGRLVTHDGVRVLVCGRHSAGHKVPPHRVNYAAIALGMKAAGVRACFATAAVGSLRTEWGPGTLVLCSDFFDFSARNSTLFNRSVTHTDFTDPFGRVGRAALRSAATAKGIPIQTSGTYLCLNGPRYETPEEIQLYRKLGADLVGMTASSEAILMREAGVDYSCLAIVTNLASGISESPLSHQEVVDEMKRSGERAVSLLLDAAAEIAGGK